MQGKLILIKERQQMAEQTLKAGDIIEARKESERQKKEFMEETLNSVLEGWKKEAQRTGRMSWVIEEDDPKWLDAFKINQSQYPGIYIGGYMKELRDRGFEVEEKYVESQEEGFWIFKKVVREAHWKFKVTAREEEK